MKRFLVTVCISKGCLAGEEAGDQALSFQNLLAQYVKRVQKPVSETEFRASKVIFENKNREAMLTAMETRNALLTHLKSFSSPKTAEMSVVKQQIQATAEVKPQ